MSTEIERQTGRRYTSEFERRMLAWARAELPEMHAPPEGFDPEVEVFFTDLDDRCFGLVAKGVADAALDRIAAELEA